MFGKKDNVHVSSKVPTCKASSVDTSLTLETGSWSNWFPGEKQICNEFRSAYNDAKIKSTYQQGIAYLEAAGESGRTPMSLLNYIMIGFLLLVEGVMLAYLMVGRSSGSLSETVAQVGGFLGGITIAIVLGIIMHVIGHYFYRGHVLHSIRQTTEVEGGKLTPKDISIGKNDDDKNDQDHVRVFHRFGFGQGSKAKHFIIGSLIAAILVPSIAGGIVIGVRTAAMNDDVKQERKAADEMQAFLAEEGSSDTTVEAETETPDVVNDGNQAAQYSIYGMGFFYILAQFIGIYMGYSKGFGSKHGDTAYKHTKEFATEDEAEEYYASQKERLRDACDQCLNQFRKRIREDALGHDATKVALENASQRNLITYMKLIDKDNGEGI